MEDVPCSTDGCKGTTVFQHIQFMPSGRNHVVSLCRDCKKKHDAQVHNAKALEHLPIPKATVKTPEDTLADSAILIIKRLREDNSAAADAAFERIRDEVQ